MNKIKILHEAPLSIMEHVQQLTDGDYCLPHLMDESEQYKQFFLKSKKLGRHIMMDNSLHELGKPYSEDRLFYWLDQLQPNEFFVPDYWEDKTQSIVSAREWINYQKLYPNTTFIAVVQAKDLYEAIECYQIYKDLGYKKIAFSYGASYYSETNFPHPNKNLGKALGRIRVISTLYKLGAINKTDKIHLLGCSVPQEFGCYKDMPFIESLDTSNPIMAALDGVHYQPWGLDLKPKSNMNDSFNIDITKIDLKLIERNVELFRKINGL